MAKIHLLVLGALYLGFALWCTVRPRATAEAIGYRLPGASALSEYVVVYGGLELGLALFFGLGALRASVELPALWLAFLLHASLALYRAGTFLALSGVSPLVKGLFALELAIAVVSGLLLLGRGLPA